MRPALWVTAAAGVAAILLALVFVAVGTPGSSRTEGAGAGGVAWLRSPVALLPGACGAVVLAGVWARSRALMWPGAAALLIFSLVFFLGVGAWFLPFALLALGSLLRETWVEDDVMARTARKLRRGVSGGPRR
ncbi:MAG: hypothetical protein QOE90_716 [Thermoplasmata archaeon]|jgi:hypothetical protein|nr:hypothetical protein [Thermoplasmata archaeon]